MRKILLSHKIASHLDQRASLSLQWCVNSAGLLCLALTSLIWVDHLDQMFLWHLSMNLPYS